MHNLHFKRWAETVTQFKRLPLKMMNDKDNFDSFIYYD